MIEPFVVDVDQDVLDDLDLRLSRTRLPDQIPGTGWDHGVDVEYLSTLLDYWRNCYDWRAAESRLNALPHFQTRIDGQTIHFVHARSPHRDATPLLMVHGWPGSFVEFLGVVDRMTMPERFGGRPEDAFHLIMPSLPGYGFSEPPRSTGWGPTRIGAAFAELMRRLGYGRYGVQGGDWGAIVAGEMALADQGQLIGLHTNMPMALPPEPPPPLTQREIADIADMAYFRDHEMGYAVLQGSKPQSIGVSLNDSPAGLCAWIVEKFRAWSDCEGEVETVIDRDTILTNVMLYWVTATATSAARLYYEFFHGQPTWSKGKISVPTGVARFPKEMNRPPRAWVEASYNVVHWTEMPRGGHFAALEQPILFSDDVQRFFRELKA